MTPLELDYIRSCTQSHARDLLTAKAAIRYSSGDKEAIIRIIDKVGRGIDMMYLTLESQVTPATPPATTSNLKVTDND